jgi:hypothetical protein
VNCYLVRVVGSRDLVGIFVAWDIVELVLLIDECLDPSICEFTELPPGSLYWSERSVVVPIRRRRKESEDYMDDDSEIPWIDVTLSESWWYALHTRQRWEAIDPQQASTLRKKRGRKRPKRKSAQIIMFRRKDKPEK